MYFLDEATGLAAGHRPCGECRSRAYRAFKAAWTRAHPAPDTPSAASIDARLHTDRLRAPGVHRRYRDRLAVLPDGAMITADERFWLVLGHELLAWSPGGYRQRRARTDLDEVTVVTPRSTVACLTAGYLPELHPSTGSTSIGTT